MPPKVLVLLVMLVSLLAASADVSAQTAANVLVVANEASADSVKIAEYYVSRRDIPPDQLLHIRTAVADEVSRELYDREIQRPIAAWLSRHSAQDRILYIVLTKGVPLRITGTIGRSGSVASVDSELTLLYRRMTGQRVRLDGGVNNPYFLGTSPIDGAKRFSHVDQDIYLVARLDAFAVADVIAVIDRAATPSSEGRVLLDQRTSTSPTGNDWLATASQRLQAQGFGDRVTLESTGRVLDREQNVLAYYSWGSNDPAMIARAPEIKFVPGAIAAMFVSTDARTFTEPPPTWRIGRMESSQTYYAGSPQSLTGDLIRAGVTGIAGHVAEPYLDATIRPEILFPAYLGGFNLVESFYLAMPNLSWQTVVVGDPLCAPFKKAPLSSTDLDSPIDPETELPARFSARSLAAPIAHADKSIAKLRLRAESRFARDDSGTRQALEELLARDESQNDAWRTLALIYEKENAYAKATEIYKRLVEREPQDVIALNNLAYALAIREQQPQEGLVYAERAHRISPRNAQVADTLGWIKHLLGDDAGAAPLVAGAAAALPSSAEAQLHAGVVLAATGRLDLAQKALEAAVRLDATLKERPDFQEAQQKVARGRK